MNTESVLVTNALVDEAVVATAGKDFHPAVSVLTDDRIRQQAAAFVGPVAPDAAVGNGLPLVVELTVGPTSEDFQAAVSVVAGGWVA